MSFSKEPSKTTPKRYNRKCVFKTLIKGQKVWKGDLRARTFADRWLGRSVIKPPTKSDRTYVVKRTGGTKDVIEHYNYLNPYNVRQKEKSQQRNNPKEKYTADVPSVDIDQSEDSDSEMHPENETQRTYPERDRPPPIIY